MPVKRVVKAVLASLIGCLVLGFMFADAHEAGGGGKFVRLDMVVMLIAAALVSYVAMRIPFLASTERKRIPGALAVLLGVMALVLVSGIIKHPRFFFIQWIGDRWEVSYKYGFYRWLLFGLILVPVLAKMKSKTWLLTAAILVYAQIYSYDSLMRGTHGLALYRDDHPSFMLRLDEFASTFPVLLNYNPLWNGGVESFVGVSSGIPSVGLPLFPLWRSFPVSDIYTQCLGVLFIFVMPWVAFASLRVAGCRSSGAFAAGVMSLGVGSIFFLWMLHFGTVGAAFSSSFILPLSAVSMGVVWLDKMRWYHFVFLVLCAFMLLLWPPGAIIAAPLAVSFLLSWRKLKKKTVVFLLLAVLCTLLLVAHQFVVVMLSGDELMGYVTDRSADAAKMPLWKGVIAGMTILVKDMNRANPVIVFMGMLSLVLLPYKSLRRWYAPVLLFLAVLSGWGRHIEPKMQLERMIIPMLFVAVVPASFACARIFESRGGRSTLAKAALASLLLLCGRASGQYYANKSIAPYVTANEKLDSAVEWIKDNVPEGSRLLFAGRVVHAFNGGHVAYLPVMTGREMMACDYYHFPPELVEYNYPPAGIRSNVKKMDKFLDVYAVSHVLTYETHANWVEYLSGRTNRFEELVPGPGLGFRAYKVIGSSGLFLQNSGTVTADYNHISLTVDDTGLDAIVGYNWSDRFRVSGDAKIFPYKIFDGVVLLGVSPNGERNIEIRYKGM